MTTKPLSRDVTSFEKCIDLDRCAPNYRQQGMSLSVREAMFGPDFEW